MPGIREMNHGALELLVIPLRDYSHGQAVDIDLSGKSAEFAGEQETAYTKRVLAARAFSRLNCFQEAAFSYDRAAKQAEGLGYIMPAIICRIRACKLYSKLGFTEESKELGYAQIHIASMTSKYSWLEMENGTEEPSTSYKNPNYRKERSMSVRPGL